MADVAAPISASYRCFDCGATEYSVKRVSRGWLVKCDNCGGWYLIEVRRG
jgi:DNA-directed RNA polymerase subunit RPC12/RpoP